MVEFVIYVIAYVAVAAAMAGFVDGEVELPKKKPNLSGLNGLLLDPTGPPTIVYMLVWPAILAGLLFYLPYHLGTWIAPTQWRMRRRRKLEVRETRVREIEEAYRRAQREFAVPTYATEDEPDYDSYTATDTGGNPAPPGVEDKTQEALDFIKQADACRWRPRV